MDICPAALGATIPPSFLPCSSPLRLLILYIPLYPLYILYTQPTWRKVVPFSVTPPFNPPLLFLKFYPFLRYSSVIPVYSICSSSYCTFFFWNNSPHTFALLSHHEKKVLEIFFSEKWHILFWLEESRRNFQTFFSKKSFSVNFLHLFRILVLEL